MRQAQMMSEKMSTGTFASFRIKNFRYLLGSTVLSNAAQWIQMVALSWIVYDITGSGTMLGAINLARSFASFLVIPIAGPLMDRMSRRKLALLENGFLFLITLFLATALLTGYSRLWCLFLFSFSAGMVQTVDMAIRQVLVFDLVPRNLTPNALALIQTGWGVMRSLGPALGGFLILWFGPHGNFFVQAGIYVLIAITLLQIEFPPKKTVDRDYSLLKDLVEATRYVVKERTTRTFMLLGVLLPLLIVPIFAVLPPVYAKDIFGGGPDTLGYLMSTVGLGGVVGGLLSASFRRVERRGLLQVVALLLLSVSLSCFALSQKLSSALFFLVLSGLFEMIFLVTNQVLLQLTIPDRLRGRVTALVNLNIALAPFGGLIAGFGSDLLGGPRQITLLFTFTTFIISVLFLLCSSTVREYRISQAIASCSTHETPGPKCK